MKFFFDTNVLIAAFATHGVCSDLFEHCLAEHSICISQQVLDELYEILVEKLEFPKPIVTQVVTFIRENVVILAHGHLPSPICRDTDADSILAGAISGNVDCLISGDKDLLVLKNIQGIPILAPHNFWEFEKKKTRRPSKTQQINETGM